VIRTVLQLQAKPGEAHALLTRFAELSILEHARTVEGCRGADLFVAVDDADLCLVFADWDDEQAYARWLAHPLRPGMNDALRPALADGAGKFVGSLLAHVQLGIR
jgi:quinol monooxygenase YgiN